METKEAMAEIILPDRKPLLNEAQRACRDLLREALTEAEAGLIDTIGIVACLKTGMATVMAGRRAADLNLGLDELKAKVMAAVSERNRR